MDCNDKIITDRRGTSYIRGTASPEKDVTGNQTEVVKFEVNHFLFIVFL